MIGDPLSKTLSRLVAIVTVALACFFPSFVHADLYPVADEALEQTTGANARRNTIEAEARQEATDAEAHISQSQQQAVDKLSTVLSTLSAAITDKVGMFSTQGNQLVAALATMAFAWLGIRTMLQGSSFAEAISEAVMLFFVVGMASWAVNADTLGKAVQAGFDMITGNILTSSGYGAEDDGVKSALSTFLGMILEMYGQPTGGSFRSPSTWAPAIGVLLAKLFISLFLLSATLAYVAMYVMTQVMFGIGLILAPLLIPFYILPPLSFLATGWFKFMISAGLAKVTGALILSLTLGMTNGLTELVRQTGVENGVPFGLYSIAFLIVGIMAVMMMQAWSIGTSILTGVSRMGSGLPSKLQPGGMAAAGSATVQKAAGSAATGAGAAAGGVIGAIAGAASHALGGGSGGGGSGGSGGESGGKGSMLDSIRSGAVKGAERGAHVMSQPLQAMKEAVSGSSKPTGSGGGSGGGQSKQGSSSTGNHGQPPPSSGTSSPDSQAQSHSQSGGASGGQSQGARSPSSGDGAQNRAQGAAQQGSNASYGSRSGTSNAATPQTSGGSSTRGGRPGHGNIQSQGSSQTSAGAAGASAQRGATPAPSGGTKGGGTNSQAKVGSKPSTPSSAGSKGYRTSPQQASRPTQARYTRPSSSAGSKKAQALTK